MEGKLNEMFQLAGGFARKVFSLFVEEMKNMEKKEGKSVPPNEALAFAFFACLIFLVNCINVIKMELEFYGVPEEEAEKWIKEGYELFKMELDDRVKEIFLKQKGN